MKKYHYVYWNETDHYDDDAIVNVALDYSGDFYKKCWYFWRLVTIQSFILCNTYADYSKWTFHEGSNIYNSLNDEIDLSDQVIEINGLSTCHKSIYGDITILYHMITIFICTLI